ncbi:aromatic ring-hydroxylating dioxygenase subunit alpha [Leptolyngbya sp. GB1-A1]|uniref:aromatic ring-hydroxylating oxygenase subunit alpha n=1 Tax=Leptolyngbya sp. GB1-A1 TaxID=2933908 RepID=UPI00329789FD
MVISLSNISSQKKSTFFAAPLYTSAALLTFEQQHIFRQTWLYIGRAKELMQSATVRAIEVAGTSVLITHGKDGNLRAFHNVCPHRAALFCSEAGLYQLKHLICPYHAWTYSLEGDLVGVPREERFASEFCRSDYPLTPVRLEQWQDFVFLCFSDAAPPLIEFLGSIPAALNEHFTPQTTLLLQKQYSVQCNWKVYHDNTLCDYHVAVAHRTTLDVVQGPVSRYQHEFDAFVNLLYTPTIKDWRSQNPVLAELNDRSREGFFTFGIFPNLHLLALPNGVIAWLRIDPVSVDQSLLNLEIYGVPELSPSIDQLSQDFESFTAEDMAITESVQRGYASGAYHSGPVNQLEDRIVHQQQIIWQYLQAGLQRDQSSVSSEIAALLSD